MKHRTAIVTAASVAVVILAATAAIATNLGILSSGTDTGEVGALTVAATEQSEVPTTIAEVDDDTTTDATAAPDAEASESSPAGEITAYAVADAAIVTLENDGSMLTIIDVETNPGWQTAQILDGTAVDIGFVNTDGTVLRFVATLNQDGSIQTVVEDLTPVSSSDDSRYDDDDGDHDDDHGRYDDDDDDRYDDDDD